jgi:hypothetical protein
MKIFEIDSANGAKALASSKKAGQSIGGARFATEKEFASVLVDWPLAGLVTIWTDFPV